LCDECKQKPATVHFAKIVDGNKEETHLCEACAQAKSQVGFVVEPCFSINQLLAGLVYHDTPAPRTRREEKEGPCPNCGLAYGEFARLGRLGCDVCYTHFDARLEPLIKRIHAAGTHTGKVPRKASTGILLRREMDRLREELATAVSREEYEKAASIRDRLKELEGRREDRGDGDE
jgi:protein arginine kinase activator